VKKSAFVHVNFKKAKNIKCTQKYWISISRSGGEKKKRTFLQTPVVALQASGI